MRLEGHCRLSLWATISIAVASSAPVFAQAHRAIILGRVNDPSNAAVTGAEVQVIEAATNVARKTKTNEEGYFEVPGLLPGTYRVEVSHPGFRTAVVDNILVTSAGRVQVNVVLQLGTVSEAVTVVSERQLLDTASADVNTVVDQRKIAELPVGQGHALFLLQLVPGASTARSGAGMDFQPIQRYQQAVIRFNGSPQGTTEFTLDGLPNTQRGNAPAGGGSSVNPSTEVVQEVRVQTASFDASIGHTGGATVDLVLKSGTNSYHGAGFGFVRDPSWQANSWASNRAGVPKPDFTYRRWGFNGGGPVNLGRLYKGKDKTFFYYGYEKWSSFSPNPPVVITVPTESQLQGDFSALLTLGAKYQLYDPDTGRAVAGGRIQREPFPGNRIPPSRFDSVSKQFFPLWLPPNTPGTADGQNNFTYDLSKLPRDMWTSTLRLDHNLSVTHKLFGRFILSKTGIPYQSQFGRTDIANLTMVGRNRDFALSDVWTINPGFIADFRAALTRFRWDYNPIGFGYDYDKLGLGYLKSLVDTAAMGIPSVSITGYLSSGAPTFGGSAGTRQASEIRTGAAHFTRIIGAHSMKFGSEFRWYFDNRIREDQLIISFAGLYTRGPLDNSPAPPHGSGLADFLLGRFEVARLNQPVKAANLSTYQSFYLQDDWKIGSKLTLNLGLRYEREGPATERFNRALAGFAFDVDNPIAAQVRANYAQSPLPEMPVSQFALKGGLLFAGVDGNPRTIYDPDQNNFAPRIGLSYQAGKDTVIRAGYGLFYVPYGHRFIANEGSVPGFDVNTYAYSSNDGGLTFTRRLSNLFPAGLDKPVGASLGLRTYLGQPITIPAPRHNPNAYNQRWQVSVQRRIAAVHRIEVRYVANHTVKMPITRDLGALPNSFLSTSKERDQRVIDNLTALVPNPFYQVAGVGGSLGTARVIAKYQLLRPFPQFSSVRIPVPQGWSWYHALQVEFERRLANGLTLQTNYTWGKILDGLTFLNPADPVPERVIASQDRTQIWRLLALYELPFGKGRRWGANTSPALRHIISGWQLQVIPIAQVGEPIPWGNVLFRGNIKELRVNKQTAERMFNTEAGFETAPAKQLAYNVRTFPSYLCGVRYQTEKNVDFSVIKNTTITERVALQFRAESYNVFNLHVYTDANTNPTSAAFGTSTSASVPRSVQLGLRLLF